ncbi:MAG: hypothetical protein E7321_08365 [Clostridiales bacterium]|nr:hypothetical protein [Clostridiales bacterium]
MAAGAAQQAYKRTQERPPQGAPKKQNMPEKKNGSLKEKLHDIPRAAGIAIMLVMLVLALFAGNFRALQNATPKDFIRQGDVKSIVEDRIDAAMNVASVADRLGLGEVQTLYNAAQALEEAKTAREISRADQQLTAAVSNFTAMELEGEDARSMMRAADGFAEMGSFLRQEARAYNEKAEKAEKLYDSLPTRFLLPQPDMYEGI